MGIIGRFRDKSFQATDCTGADYRSHNNQENTKKTQNTKINTNKLALVKIETTSKKLNLNKRSHVARPAHMHGSASVYRCAQMSGTQPHSGMWYPNIKVPTYKASY